MSKSDSFIDQLAKLEVHAGEAEGPILWLTAGIHGDEVGGTAVIHEVFERLRREPLLKGSVYAFPLVNTSGFESSSRFVPESGEDINRSFPGNANGSVAERIAAKIFSAITESKPTLVVDLHNDWIRSIPYVLLDPPKEEMHKQYDEALSYARASGLPVVKEQKNAPDALALRGSLSGALMTSGMLALTLELGSAYVVDERYVEEGVLAVWNLLAHLGMVAKDTNTEVESIVLNYQHLPLAGKSGILRALTHPGAHIKKGEPLARIVTVFGETQELLTASDDGIVLGYSDTSAVKPGQEVLAFGIIS